MKQKLHNKNTFLSSSIPGEGRCYVSLQTENRRSFHRQDIIQPPSRGEVSRTEMLPCSGDPKVGMPKATWLPADAAIPTVSLLTAAACFHDTVLLASPCVWGHHSDLESPHQACSCTVLGESSGARHSKSLSSHPLTPQSQTHTHVPGYPR